MFRFFSKTKANVNILLDVRTTKELKAIHIIATDAVCNFAAY